MSVTLHTVQNHHPHRLTRKSNRKQKGLRLILLLAGLIGIGCGYAFRSTGQESVPLTSEYTFKNEQVRIDPVLLRDTPQPLPVPDRILIPSVGIDLPVLSSPIVNGYWKVFEDRAGWGSGSAYPGEKGNLVIFAHAREGLFLPIRQMHRGDPIYVISGSQIYMYRATETREVNPNQVEVIAPTQNETLTLYTCAGINDQKRWVVRGSYEKPPTPSSPTIRSPKS